MSEKAKRENLGQRGKLTRGLLYGKMMRKLKIGAACSEHLVRLLQWNSCHEFYSSKLNINISSSFFHISYSLHYFSVKLKWLGLLLIFMQYQHFKASTKFFFLSHKQNFKNPLKFNFLNLGYMKERLFNL